MTKDDTIIFQVEPEQKQKIKQEAEKRGLSMSGFVRSVSLKEAQGEA